MFTGIDKKLVSDARRLRDHIDRKCLKITGGFDFPRWEFVSAALGERIDYYGRDGKVIGSQDGDEDHPIVKNAFIKLAEALVGAVIARLTIGDHPCSTKGFGPQMLELRDLLIECDHHAREHELL